MTEEVKQPAPEAEAQTQQESADLTVNDLNSLKTIIDIASSRGAFKPAEFAAVGQIYAKLSAFLATVNKPQGA
jgi:hypothetical protein